VEIPKPLNEKGVWRTSVKRVVGGSEKTSQSDDHENYVGTSKGAGTEKREPRRGHFLRRTKGARKDQEDYWGLTSSMKVIDPFVKLQKKLE